MNPTAASSGTDELKSADMDLTIIVQTPNLTGRRMPSLDRVLAGNTIAAMQIFATQRWKQVMDGED